MIHSRLKMIFVFLLLAFSTTTVEAKKSKKSKVDKMIKAEKALIKEQKVEDIKVKGTLDLCDAKKILLPSHHKIKKCGSCGSSSSSSSSCSSESDSGHSSICPLPPHPGCKFRQDRKMFLGTGDLSVGHGKLFNVPSRGEAFRYYKSGITQYVDRNNLNTGALAQHQIQSNRNIFNWELPRENIQLLASRPVSTLETDSAFSGTSDNWAFSMSSNRPGAFVWELTNEDFLFFDKPNFFTPAGSTGFGAGRLGDIMDIRDPVTGYKLRLWGANPGFSVSIQNYNPQDYNPGPAYFGGNPNEVADFVLGIDNWAALTFEDSMLRFMIAPELLADFLFVACYQDGTFVDFPDGTDIQNAVSNGLLYYYNESPLPFEMSGVGDTFFGPATFSLSLTGENAFLSIPEVTHLGVVWNNPGTLPPGGYHDQLRPGGTGYDPNTDYNPFRTGDAVLQPYGFKRIGNSENGPVTYPGLENSTFGRYENQLAQTVVRSYTIGTTLNGVHVFTHDTQEKPMNAKLLRSFDSPSVFEDAVPTGLSTWHDVKTYQSQELELTLNDDFDFVPLALYDVVGIPEGEVDEFRYTACQFLSKEENNCYRFKCPFSLDRDVLAPLAQAGTLKIVFDETRFATIERQKNDFITFYQSAENAFAGIAVFDMSSLRSDPDSLPESAELKGNNLYGNIELPGKTLNSGTTVPVSYTRPYAFDQTAQNVRFNGQNPPDYQLTFCHNLYVDEVLGRLFCLGAGINRGSVVVFDIKTDPTQPIFLGQSATFYIHDMGTTTYNREEALRLLGYELPENQETLTLGIAASEIAYFLVDWTGDLDYNTADFGGDTGIIIPRVLASVPLSQLNINLGYAHNAWPTTDKRYFIAGDEFVDQIQNLGTNDSRAWDNTWILEHRYNNESGEWVLASAQHIFGATPTKQHNGYLVNESQDPFEDWYFRLSYKGGLRISSFTYNEGFPIDYTKVVSDKNELLIQPPSWQNGGPGGPNSDPYHVVEKAHVVADPYEPRAGAGPAFGGGWSCTPFTEALDTPASKRLVIFDDGQAINWGRYQFGNSNSLTPDLNVVNDNIRLLTGGTGDTPVEGREMEHEGEQTFALALYEDVGAQGQFVSKENGSLFKSNLYPGIAVNSAPDLDLRVLIWESTYNLEDYMLPTTDEMPKLQPKRPGIGEKVYVVGPADQILEGEVIMPYVSDYVVREELFQDDETSPFIAIDRQLVEFTRKSEMLIKIPADPGFSGKPVFNRCGEILGFIRDKSLHGETVGVIGADVVQTMADKTKAALDGYWVQSVRNDLGGELSLHDSFTDPMIIENDPKPLCVYKDEANDIVYGFLNTLSTGPASAISYFIDPVEIIDSGNGTDPNPLTAIQLIGRIFGSTGRAMGVRGMTENGSIDYPSSVGLRFDGYIEPYRPIPLTNYTPGTFTPGEILTGVIQDGPNTGQVRSRVLYIRDGDPLMVNGMMYDTIVAYPVVLEGVNTTPWWRVPAGEDTALSMTTGELLTGAQSAVMANVVDGFQADDADAIDPMPSWSKDGDGVFDPTKALFRRLYFKNTVVENEYFAEGENEWYNPEDSFFQEALSWYQENATPARWFSTRTIDSAEGLVSSSLRTADRAVLGVSAQPLDATFFAQGVNSNVSGKAADVSGINFALEFNWSVDPRIIDTHVMITNLDSEVEMTDGNDPFEYGDIIYGWKLCDDVTFKNFNIHTWFAETAGIADGTCVDIQVLRYNPADEKFTTEVVVRRVLLGSEQNRLHTI